jgi:fatty-acyl-CoA synthase
MSTGVDVVIGAPQDFLAAPLRWLEWLSTFGGTATAGPNFSWVLATRALRNASGLDLSPLRIALNGAEPVDPDAVEQFVDAAVPHKMRPGAVFPAFGMAEVVIGATFPAPLSGLRPDAVDRRVLDSAARYLVSRFASSIRRTARCVPNERSASSRSAARR